MYEVKCELLPKRDAILYNTSGCEIDDGRGRDWPTDVMDRVDSKLLSRFGKISAKVPAARFLSP